MMPILTIFSLCLFFRQCVCVAGVMRGRALAPRLCVPVCLHVCEPICQCAFYSVVSAHRRCSIAAIHHQESLQRGECEPTSYCLTLLHLCLHPSPASSSSTSSSSSSSLNPLCRQSISGTVRAVYTHLPPPVMQCRLGGRERQKHHLHPNFSQIVTKYIYTLIKITQQIYV